MLADSLDHGARMKPLTGSGNPVVHSISGGLSFTRDTPVVALYAIRCVELMNSILLDSSMGMFCGLPFSTHLEFSNVRLYRVLLIIISRLFFPGSKKAPRRPVEFIV